MGFNRYIVECKFLMTVKLLWLQSRFNRYIVECKSAMMTEFVSFYEDLIDT